MQLGREVALAQAAGVNPGYSSNLVSALIARTADNIGRIDLPALVDRRKAHRDLGFASGVIIAFLALTIGRRISSAGASIIFATLTRRFSICSFRSICKSHPAM